jgi:multidrug efflux pump subunit AcrA (membrane-fusion protein)
LAAVSLREIEATPPARVLAATLWTLAGMVSALLAWSVIARLDIVATAPGKVVPPSQVKLVQSAEPGIVRKILVRDGDRDSAGAVLLGLDATSAGADAATVANELMLKRTTLRAIDAKLANGPLAAVVTDSPLVFA